MAVKSHSSLSVYSKCMGRFVWALGAACGVAVVAASPGRTREWYIKHFPMPSLVCLLFPRRRALL